MVIRVYLETVLFEIYWCCGKGDKLCQICYILLNQLLDAALFYRWVSHHDMFSCMQSIVKVKKVLWEPKFPGIISLLINI